MSALSVALEPGTLYGVGVGPGDPGLVTRRAWGIAAAAPVVAYVAADSSDGAARPSRALGIVAEAVRPDAEHIEIRLPMRVGREAAAAAYDAGAARVAAALDQGRAVAALCEGDPLLYGSFMHLQARLSDRYPIHATPGVPSFAAAAAAARTPLVERMESFAIIPATLPDAEIETRLSAADAAAFLKVGRHAPRLRALLRRLGRLGDALLIEEASGAGERVAPFAESGDAPYFALVLLPRRGA